MKTGTKIIIALAVVFVLLPLIGYWALFSPHTYRFFIDRERVSEEFSLDLTDDVKLVSYYDGSILIAIDTELIVETDDAESFLQNNVRRQLEEDTSGSFDYKYGRIYVKTEPYEGRYRIHFRHME